jgi:hypothetical protein
VLLGSVPRCGTERHTWDATMAGQAEPTAPTADEQLQAELDAAEYVLGWRPKPKDYARITYSGDGLTWTVWTLPAGHPRARQIAVYDVDRPRKPDYAAAKCWNEGRERAVSHYRYARQNERQRERLERLPASVREPVATQDFPRRAQVRHLAAPPRSERLAAAPGRTPESLPVILIQPTTTENMSS